MDAYNLKQIIRDNDKVQFILEDLGLHHIEYKDGGYWSCGMPPDEHHDGNNPSSTTIYDSEFLTVVAYTRNINPNPNAPSDIFTLIQFIHKCSFFKAMNYVCELLGLDYYEDENEDIPLSLQFLSEIEDMASGEFTEKEYKTKIRDTYILNYYDNVCNNLFKNDGISYQTQKEFQIGYDSSTNRITIPIFNELSQLVGVKGRVFDESLQPNTSNDKYIYLERCNKTHILYGLYKTYEYIIRAGIVYVGESEKFVMQLWSNGIYNAVALGGHKISKCQLILLQRMGVKVVLCFDKDIRFDKIDKNDESDTIRQECDKFENWIKVYYMVDNLNLLGEKESPSDNIDNFIKLRDECVYEYVKENI